METSLCQRGVAQRALSTGPNGGGAGEGTAPFPSELHPSQTGPLTDGTGQRERERRTEASAGALAKGRPSVICDALGSQFLLHPSQVGGVRIPKPGAKRKEGQS